MRGQEPAQGLRAQEGEVPVEDEQGPVSVAREGLTGGLHGMAGAQGRVLADEGQPPPGEGRLHRLRLVADHDRHRRRSESLHRPDDVLQQRRPEHRVQDLDPAALHPRATASARNEINATPVTP